MAPILFGHQSSIRFAAQIMHAYTANAVPQKLSLNSNQCYLGIDGSGEGEERREGRVDTLSNFAPHSLDVGEHRFHSVDVVRIWFVA